MNAETKAEQGGNIHKAKKPWNKPNLAMLGVEETEGKTMSTMETSGTVGTAS